MLPRNLSGWSIFHLLDSTFASQIHTVVVYGNLGKEALIITKNKKVYGIGSNSNGCLGIGYTHSTLQPKLIEELSLKDVKTFACGSGPHVLALTHGGQVYSWGHNSYCELGNGTAPQSLTPTLVKSNLSAKCVVDVACGSHHSLALTLDGEVYAWGLNTSGQVGCGIYTSQNSPRKVNNSLSGKNVVCISCGDSSSIAVTSNGEVYSWGYNGVGQLGIENFVNQSQPCRVKALAGIVIEKVVSGYTHTLALSDEGVAYVWGANSYGQLGLNTETNVWTPTKLEVPGMGRILDIAASHYNHISVAMCNNNEIFVWGHCLTQSIKTPMLTRLRSMHDAFAYFASPSVTYQPLVLHNDGETNLLDSLRKAFDDSTTSDLVIQVYGKPIHVHKAILKIRCNYFRSMFQDHWIENSKSIIEHNQFSYDTYNAFLKYLYTNEIDLPAENALELLDLANVYSEDQLRERCVRMIKKGITVANVAFLYSTSIKYTDKASEECCFRFALNHMTAVTQTENFSKLNESTIKSFIIKAARAGAFKTYKIYLTMIPFSLKNWSIFTLLNPKFIPEIHMAVVFGSLGNEALIVTKDDMVYAIGSNKCGCLGIGDTQSTSELEQVTALCKKGVKTIAYGTCPHVLALTESGEVYSWGHNGHSELGNGSTEPCLVPTRIGRNLSKKFVTHIACGNHHSLALTAEGEVFAWGENNYGQVGNNTGMNQNAPRKVNSTLAGKKVISISCGHSTSMAVTDNGEVYGWGYNGLGQLGITNCVNQADPCKLTTLVGTVIERVACGFAHAMALTNQGVLYVWGANNWGQLGLGNKINSCIPNKLEIQKMGRVMDIATSYCNSISVAEGEDNQIFMWGQCLEQSIIVPTLTSLEYIHDVFACFASSSVMHEPLILRGEEEDLGVADSLREAFDDPTTSDLVIQVQERSISVHKVVLMIRSQYFKTLFEKNLPEYNQGTIQHDEFSYDVYRAFLKYLYTDEIYLPAENALELLKLANDYSESQLKKRSIEMIRKGITIENVAYLYSVALEYSSKELEECCFKFALNHMTAVTQTANFAKLDGNVIKRFISNAAFVGAFKT
ncbi:uncharacterized protein LOC143427199 [Xylocopa sonorina]|uniref:uncharacterized protein LOC143427199 n=1 Tax=Xylocopa sonorina TaxID=1818115 RepID=UPI00403AC082